MEVDSDMRTKRKRFSKKNKRSWRKHTNVKDVEEYLEGRRREEKFGVPASEKAAEDLYFIQREASSDCITLSRKQRRQELREKPLCSESNLTGNPNIKGFPSQRRRRVQKKEKNQQADSLDSSSDEEEYDRSTSYRTISRDSSKRLATHSQLHPPKNTVHVASKDLWSEDSEEESLNDEHYLRVTRRKKTKRPSTLMTTPSQLDNVELPHSGMSYNPSFEDHQELLRMAVTVEENKLKAAEKLNKKLQLAEMTHEQREKVWLEEMREGIPGEEGSGKGAEKEEEEEEESGEVIVKKRPIRAEGRKTKKQRRKEQLRKKEEQMRKLAKAQKMRMDEVYRLRSLKKEIVHKETAILKKRAHSQNMKLQSLYSTRRLGRHVYKEPDIPVQLSSEVTGALRSLKPEGSLAVERYKSLQKRNIIEPREVVRARRKYKLLIKEKRSAKIPEDKNYSLQ